MSHSITRRSRAIAVTVAALVSVPVLAGTANAVPADMYAPYARAAAMVHEPGTLLAAKNISEVTHPKVGTYCLKVSDPDIDDLQNAAILATANNGGASVTVRTAGYGVTGCPAAPTSSR